MLENEARISSCQDKQGELYLRKNLLSYLQRIRGVTCDKDQIIITCGIQQFFRLSLQAVPAWKADDSNGGTGIHKAAAVFSNNNINVQKVPVDEHGIVVSKLPRVSDACAVYSTPSHQFQPVSPYPPAAGMNFLNGRRRMMPLLWKMTLTASFDITQNLFRRCSP